MKIPLRSISYLRPKTFTNHTLWGSTYLYRLHRGGSTPWKKQSIQHGVIPENINTPSTPQKVLFGLNHTPPPWNFQFSLSSYFPLKIVAIKTPLPIGISNELPRGEYGYFLETHIIYNSPVDMLILNSSSFKPEQLGGSLLPWNYYFSFFHPQLKEGKIPAEEKQNKNVRPKLGLELTSQKWFKTSQHTTSKVWIRAKVTQTTWDYLCFRWMKQLEVLQLLPLDGMLVNRLLPPAFCQVALTAGATKVACNKVGVPTKHWPLVNWPPANWPPYWPPNWPPLKFTGKIRKTKLKSKTIQWLQVNLKHT